MESLSVATAPALAILSLVEYFKANFRYRVISLGGEGKKSCYIIEDIGRQKNNTRNI